LRPPFSAADTSDDIHDVAGGADAFAGCGESVPAMLVWRRDAYFLMLTTAGFGSGLAAGAGAVSISSGPR